MPRHFCHNFIAGSHARYGYANFGFKTNSQKLNRKYSDRTLYKFIPESQDNPDFNLIQSFAIQKAGNKLSECEDMWQQSSRDRRSRSNPRVAIALSDGATESSFAREWAKELVKAFVMRSLVNRSLINRSMDDWLSPLQTAWQQWLANQNLSWFAKRKAGEGAFATFLSLEIGSDLSWQSFAVGDSCLFVVRDRHLQKSFPLQNSQEFNNRPKLIGTHTKITNINFLEIHGQAQVGDRFYLTTDAIACWIFKQLEENQHPWLKLDQICSQDVFEQWVNELRDRHEIANDDTTLLCLEAKMSGAMRCPS